MAGETKSDNKIFQLVMVVITTIVAPVSVYIITHSFDSKAAAVVTLEPTTQASEVAELAVSPTELSQLTFTPALADLTATPAPQTPTPQDLVSTPASPTPSPTETSTPAVQSTLTSTPTDTPQAAQPSPTVVEASAPQGILPAGEPVVVEDMAVQVNPEEITLENGLVSITLHVRNQSSTTQSFTYTVRSLRLVDSAGVTLEDLTGEKRDICDKKDFDAKKTLKLAPNQEVILQSVAADKPNGWCASKVTDLLPLYQAANDQKSQSLRIEFSKFGPFDQFGFEINLSSE